MSERRLAPLWGWLRQTVGEDAPRPTHHLWGLMRGMLRHGSHVLSARSLEMNEYGPADLDAFVAKVDSFGGPGFPGVDDYWRGFNYAPVTAVDTSLDPFGAAYFEQQIALYREISGRTLDQTANEHTVFDPEAHLNARNPYNHGEPGVLANHLVQLTMAMRLANPRRGARMVDMGCGWGLSTELGSYLGLEVEAVDINPDFVELVRARSERYRYDIKPVQAGFDDYLPDASVDLVLFYECLHHAVEPWALLSRLSKRLSSGGKIVACGEPINTFWWPHWGLRLDPMSVYCIRKHGWFESGWSREFIVACMDRALLNTSVVTHPEPQIGDFIIGAADPLLSPDWMVRNCEIVGAALDGDYLVATGDMRIIFRTSLANAKAEISLHSFRDRPVTANMRWNDGPIVPLSLQPGETRLPVDGTGEAGTSLTIVSETWVPAQEIGNLDTRRLAFQIGGIAIGRA